MDTLVHYVASICLKASYEVSHFCMGFISISAAAVGGLVKHSKHLA